LFLVIYVTSVLFDRLKCYLAKTDIPVKPTCFDDTSFKWVPPLIIATLIVLFEIYRDRKKRKRTEKEPSE
jgi:hypothetical protein